MFENLPANRTYTITEPERSAPVREPAKELPPLFAASTALDTLHHVAILVGDLDDVVLLPSPTGVLTQGPGAARVSADQIQGALSLIEGHALA